MPRPLLDTAMTRWHSLLERQLCQAYPAGLPDDLADAPALDALLALVDQAYRTGDAERGECARSLQASLDELAERNRVLQQQVDQLTRLDQIMAERTDELDQRNRNLTLLLNNVAQGFATVNLDGTLRPDCSQAFTRWFGAPRSDMWIWSLLAGDDANLAAWIQLGFESIHSELMPIDVVLGQLPRRLERAGRQLRVEYQPIGLPLTAILLVVSDATDELARQRAEAAQHELLAVVDNAYRDRAGFLAFIRDTSELLRDPPTSLALPELKRRLHTLKGNAAMFGAASVGDACHELENRIEAESAPPDAESWALLLDAWHAFHDRVDELLHVSQRRTVLVDWEEYQAVLGSMRDDEPSWAAQIRRWSEDPTRPHLEHFAERARQLARRLGKAELDIELRDNDLRVDGDRFAPLWSALVHTVRNAVDHGLESTEDRLARGKPVRATLVLSTELRGGELVIEIRDDGKGIDWSEIARRAQAMGLPTRTRRDLIDAVFASGLSTAAELTQTSGRGLGMSALRATCTDLGGRVDLISETGRGTTVRCCVPLARAAPRTRGASLYRV